MILNAQERPRDQCKSGDEGVGAQYVDRDYIWLRCSEGVTGGVGGVRN
jgi:hypothetical protein